MPDSRAFSNSSDQFQPLHTLVGGGGPLPFDEPYPGASFVLAFRALPLVILVSAPSAVLYHYRALPWVVRGFAYALGKALKIGGAASFATAANVFTGMVEAPLLVRPYFDRMTRSELFVVMTGGMATIATAMTGAIVPVTSPPTSDILSAHNQ